MFIFYAIVGPVSEILSAEELDTIKFQAWKIQHASTRESFDHLRFLLGDRIDVGSEFRALRIMSKVSGLSPIAIDCCIKACMAFTGKYEALNKCLHCNAPRYNAQKRPQNKFHYIPLIPQLTSFFQNLDLKKLLSHRHDFEYDPSTISDFFSTDRYRALLQTRVKIEDEDSITHTLDHCHFSDPRDIAFTLYSDGVQLFKKSKSQKSCAPILLVILNLPLAIRTLIDNLICLGVIPGTAKDPNSFLPRVPKAVERRRNCRSHYEGIIQAARIHCPTLW